MALTEALFMSGCARVRNQEWSGARSTALTRPGR